jgi:hypothetical protein
MCTGWLKNVKDERPFEDSCLGGCIILSGFKKMHVEGVNCIHLPEDRVCIWLLGTL